MKISKNKFLLGFCMVTLLLAAVRCIFPSIAHNSSAVSSSQNNNSPENMVSPGGGDAGKRDQPVLALRHRVSSMLTAAKCVIVFIVCRDTKFRFPIRTTCS